VIPGSRETPRVAGSAGVVGIAGHPVSQSLSPTLQNAAFAAAGLDWVYVALDVLPENLAPVLAGARTLGLRGLNVTAPHKVAAAGIVDRLVGAAADLGAVNTIVFDAEAMVGHSTDGEGFLAALEDEAFPVEPGLTAMVLGAGGAGMSVAHALLGRDAKVILANRDRERLRTASARLSAALPAAASRLRPMALDDPELGRLLAETGLLVGAMSGGSELLGGLDLGGLPASAAVTDLRYHPAVPPLVAAARERGLRAWNGLGMLVHQGAASFTLWTGLPAPVAAMARAAGYTRLARGLQAR
jgi:shikimate dehydrogenase